MGGHYGTIHVRTEDRDAVRVAVESLACERTRRFLIAPAINGWVTLYPENNGQDPAVSEALAAKLAEKTLIHCLVHDDDVFAYWLFEGGRIVDTYNSCPDYFGDHNPPPRGGNASALSHLLLDQGKVGELQALLDEDSFDFELERQDQFAALLGLPNTAYAYEYLRGGETDGVQRWKQFIHVPDLAPEKSARRAAAAKERTELKGLQRDAVLLVNETAGKGGNKHFLKVPLWAIDPAISAVVLTWQDYSYGEVAAAEWRCLSAPHWRAEKWDGVETERSAGLQFSPAGSWFAIQSQNRSQIDVWDGRGKRPVAQKEFTGSITAMAFSADENWLFVVVHNQTPSTQLHRLALRPGLEDAVLTDEILHFQTIGPHPGGSLLAVVDDFGILLVVDIQTMRIANQVWIKETNPLLPESVRGEIINDAMDKFQGVLKDHMSAGELDRYRQQSARHFWPKESIHTCCFSLDGNWLFCGTNYGLRCLDWNNVLQCSEMRPVPVQLPMDAEPVSSDLGGGAAFAHRLVYAIGFDALRRRVLFSGLEGKISFVELNDGRTGDLLVVPGRIPLIQLALTPDRSALVATGHRRVARSNCRIAGLDHRTALVPWVPAEPVGAERLQQLFHEPELIDSKD